MTEPYATTLTTLSFQTIKNFLVTAGDYTSKEVRAKEGMWNAQRKRLDRTVAALRERGFEPARHLYEITAMISQKLPEDPAWYAGERIEMHGVFFDKWISKEEKWTDEEYKIVLPDDLAMQLFKYTIEYYMASHFPEVFDPASGAKNYAKYVEKELVTFFCEYSLIFLTGYYSFLADEKVQQLKEACHKMAESEATDDGVFWMHVAGNPDCCAQNHGSTQGVRPC